MSVSEKYVLLEYPDESTGPLLKVNTGWGLLVRGKGRGELREEREDELPMWSRDERRFN